MVQAALPGTAVRYAESAGPDPRSYRVACSKAADLLPEFKPQWSVLRGIEESAAAFARTGFNREDFAGSRYARIRHVRKHLSAGLLDQNLRWTTAGAAHHGAALPDA